MDKLKIEKSKKNNDTITRTIRISGKTFDKMYHNYTYYFFS